MSSLTRMSSSCPGSSSSSFHSCDENWQSRPSSRHSSRPPSEPSENGGQGPAASSRSDVLVEQLDRMQHQSPAWMTSKQPGHNTASHLASLHGLDHSMQHAADRTPQVDGVPIATLTHDPRPGECHLDDVFRWHGAGERPDCRLGDLTHHHQHRHLLRSSVCALPCLVR